MKQHLWPLFLEAVKRDVVPALGCTEPISVALAAAIAIDELGMSKQVLPSEIKIDVAVSANLMKNGMGVGIPGTGMVGLPIAAAIGAVTGDRHAGLEVLKNIKGSDVEAAKLMLANEQVTVGVADVANVLYAKVTVYHQQQTVSVTIADSHTKVIAIAKNGEQCLVEPEAKVAGDNGSKVNPFIEAKLQDIYDFAIHTPLADISFIMQAKSLNDALSIEGLSGNYGLKIGATFVKNQQRGLLSGGLLTEVLTRTAGASDARMDGAMMPAMSNSGSGNQGIAATMPVVVSADFLKSSEEQTIRALMLSHLTAIYIKSYQNKLSALCGATTAAMGSAAGITYLLEGEIEQVSAAICSMIGDVSGVICDGAKTACAMKVSSSAGAAVKAALMAIDGIRVTGTEGIVADDVDQTIRNLATLANGAMTQTDVQILEIMMHK
ncbi:L-serine ammonia-lyase, iron-sulfur-dependent, subunit alpha [Shewanella sp. Isolate13]|uniref:L-cysteine desulfidase family protein n=1 Tax=Shewanella sp. Isolate13 TaxID=2908531 RepID=UPI001EFE48E6|nr:L-serine ammonia-lyase, iron-sulfur-dependent, subunit alpha [Shewanella sp. Isolate13]MCG9730079.1 L-serine ammonia-lyase, iron-sulfur-dependent, subunit alpha [Shewanella sp. Isolate13]